MASLVTEILASRGKAEIDDLETKIADLNEKLLDFKSEAKRVLNNKYVQFNAQHSETKSLAVKLQSLSEQMESQQYRIEKETKADLQNSTSELKDLSTQLQEMNIKIFIVKQLVDVDLKINKAGQELTKKNYREVAEILCGIRDAVRNVDVERECEPELLKGIKNLAVLRSEAFLFDVGNIWKESLICRQQKESSTPTSIVQVNISKQTSFSELVQALYLYNDLSFKMHRFSRNVLEEILTTATSNKCQVMLLGGEGSVTLQVRVVEPGKIDPIDIIVKLNEIFNFFQSTLDIKITHDLTFINLLGQNISTEFCDLFIKNVLKQAIPTNNNEREAYEKVIQETEQFQNNLESIGFLSSMNQTILEYAMNVDVHYNNKLSADTLNIARAIMKQDLHDTVEMQPQTLTLEAISNNSEEESDAQTESFASLSSSTLQFPKCLVSKSAVELMDLIRKTLKSAGDSTEMRAVRLYCTARKVIDMYCAISPTYHKKFLDTLPQQAALFHNNCMYLAHQLLTLGGEFSSLLSQVLPTQSLTFVDQMSKLRQTGAKVFLAQMQVQRKQLLDILRDSGLSKLGDEDKLPPTTEKCIRQCLRQLELLQRVWQNVLPSYVYNKAIGTVLNTLVEELIVRVCTTEDIPAETATDLVTVFTTVIDRAPRVLLEAGEVHQYVKRWHAFEELVQVLGGNLQAIDNRWADGKGPLAHEFSPDQVKSLVRALFQNTTRRAALLSKIK